MIQYFTKNGFALFMMLSLISSLGLANNITHIEDVIKQVQPQGAGRLNFWGLHIYDATLYRSLGKDSSEFALDVRYQKSFSGKAIASRTVDEMKNIGVPESQAMAWGKELAEILPNVEPGQTLTGVYSSQQGTTLFYEGKKIAQIPGADFSKAFFGIWLSPKTSAPKLRAELLGNGCPPPIISGAC
ncbi:chalcone isomerase family protein [Polynucleobacter sp. AP-Nino-20-G2]|nr:chalcone isomerase family protein [Polynucleobacter sp. AP-Nino-20-G2]